MLTVESSLQFLNDCSEKVTVLVVESDADELDESVMYKK